MQKRRKIKIVFKTDATSISKYWIIFFLFYSLSINVFQLEENVSKSPEKETHRDLVLCLFSIARLFQAFDKIVTNIKVIHSTGNVWHQIF